jgi:hypothetical protein
MASVPDITETGMDVDVTAACRTPCYYGILSHAHTCRGAVT